MGARHPAGPLGLGSAGDQPRTASDLFVFVAVGECDGSVRLVVAAGDVDGDGQADIVTGAGAGGGPRVRVFSGRDGSPLQSFYAYGPDVTGGVRVAAGDVVGDGMADLVTGAGPGGGPHVQLLDGSTLEALAGFYAYDATFAGGVFVGATR